MALIVRMKISILFILTPVTPNNVTCENTPGSITCTCNVGWQMVAKKQALNVKISKSAQQQTIVVMPMPTLLTTIAVKPVNVKMIGTQPVMMSLAKLVLLMTSVKLVPMNVTNSLITMVFTYVHVMRDLTDPDENVETKMNVGGDLHICGAVSECIDQTSHMNENGDLYTGPCIDGYLGDG